MTRTLARSLSTVIFLTTSGAADTVAANCAQDRGDTEPGLRLSWSLVNIDNQIIPLRTTECETHSSEDGADATSPRFHTATRTELRLQGSLKSALCLCVSITLPAES